MAARLRDGQKQRAVMESIVTGILKKDWLKCIKKDKALDCMLRWKHHLNENSASQELGNTSIISMPRSSLSFISVNPSNNEKVEAFISADRVITIDELELKLSYDSTRNIIGITCIFKWSVPDGCQNNWQMNTGLRRLTAALKSFKSMKESKRSLKCWC